MDEPTRLTFATESHEVEVPSDGQLAREAERLAANVSDPGQLALLKQVQQRNVRSVDQLAALVGIQTKELNGHRAVIEESRRAIEEAKSLRAKLEAAESARHAAERVAEKEKFARITAEEARDDLIAALHEANTQESRIERLLATA